MAAQPVLIAQISDLHVKPLGELAYGSLDTATAVVRCVAKLNWLRPRPELVVVSGDLVDTGLPEEYAHLRQLLEPLEIPLALIPGNHDARERMRFAFPEQPYADRSGALNFALALPALDILLLDSSVPGQPHGELDAQTLAWLDANLAGSKNRPALLFVHHPPFATGIRHMDQINLRNGAALAGVLSRHKRARLLACGHVHRPTLTWFAGLAATICPAPNQSIALDLGELGAPKFAMESLGFHLHAWFAGEGYGDVVTHFVSLDAPEARQPMIGDSA